MDLHKFLVDQGSYMDTGTQALSLKDFGKKQKLPELQDPPWTVMM